MGPAGHAGFAPDLQDTTRRSILLLAQSERNVGPVSDSGADDGAKAGPHGSPDQHPGLT